MRDDTDFLALFANETNTRHMEAGALLFAKDDPAHELFVVRSGQLRVFDGDFTLEILGPGDIIGEMALIDHSPRSASVEALVACEVIPLDEKRFLWMVEQTPRFAVRMLKVTVARLRKTNELAKAMR
jgi:CRP-like cAMP-binding protein